MYAKNQIVFSQFDFKITIKVAFFSRFGFLKV